MLGTQEKTRLKPGCNTVVVLLVMPAFPADSECGQAEPEKRDRTRFRDSSYCCRAENFKLCGRQIKRGGRTVVGRECQHEVLSAQHAIEGRRSFRKVECLGAACRWERTWGMAPQRRRKHLHVTLSLYACENL